MNTYVCSFEDSTRLFISANDSAVAVAAAESLCGHVETWDVACKIPNGIAIIPASRVLRFTGKRKR